MELWLAIIIVGVITFGLRLSFIMLLGSGTVRTSVWRALRLVPAAVLAALIIPDLVLRNGTLDMSPGNARLIAGLLAAVVAWRTRNILLTIAVGMAALLVLQMVVGSR